MKRNLSVDILRFIMAFLIVGLHVGFLKDVSGILSYFFVNGVARMGVPVYLLISGFYLYEIETLTKFLNWIKKLLYLYIIWMIIYSKFWFDYNYKGLILNVICGYLHLWYLIGTLFAFIFVWIIRNVKLKKQVALLIGCGILGILLQYARSYDLIEMGILRKLGLNAYRNGLLFCSPFVLIGYFINKFGLHKKHINWLLLMMLGICLLLIETFINYAQSGKSFDILLSLYLLCPVLFIYTLNQEFYSNNKTLSLYATGIYLSHIFILEIFKRFEVLTNVESFRTIAVFVISVFLTFILIKLKKKFKYIL